MVIEFIYKLFRFKKKLDLETTIEYKEQKKGSDYLASEKERVFLLTMRCIGFYVWMAKPEYKIQAIQYATQYDSIRLGYYGKRTHLYDFLQKNIELLIEDNDATWHELNAFIDRAHIFVHYHNMLDIDLNPSDHPLILSRVFQNMVTKERLIHFLNEARDRNSTRREIALNTTTLPQS